MSESDFVHLPNGPLVPLAAYMAVADIEHAGHTLTIDGDDILVERGRGLTVDPDLLTTLRMWKAHAWLLLNYTANDTHLRPRCQPTATREATS